MQRYRILAISFSVCLPLLWTSASPAADVLVADRLTDSVYRYSASGAFLNVVLRERDVDPEFDFVNEPTGLTLSPDGTQLYVSSSQNDRVVRYDYDAAFGLASNPFVFATAANGLSFPNAITFNPAGDTIYVSNLRGGTGLARFNVDGSSAGPNLLPFGAGGAFQQFTGLAWTPSGELLVGGFADDSTDTTGAIGKSDVGVNSLQSFIGPSTALLGASGVLVHENYVYATGMFGSRLQRFNLSDGTRDTSFEIAGLAFPQQLVAAPGGNGFLAGILGYSNGAGRIAHYDFNGAPIGNGIFASPGGGGFTEATAFAVVPDVPGDFNGDRAVDGVDLTIWKTNFGQQAGQATLAMGDADGNKIVDGNDFLIWQRHLTQPPALGTHAVPEPASLGLVAIALGALSRRRLARRGTPT